MKNYEKTTKKTLTARKPTKTNFGQKSTNLQVTFAFLSFSNAQIFFFFNFLAYVLFWRFQDLLTFSFAYALLPRPWMNMLICCLNNGNNYAYFSKGFTSISSVTHCRKGTFFDSPMSVEEQKNFSWMQKSVKQQQ